MKGINIETITRTSNPLLGGAGVGIVCINIPTNQ
jgi:hypothetical protein